MSKVLCDICHGCGCAHCGGLGFFIEDGPEDDREPPTFEECYSDEIARAGYVKLAPDEVVVKRATAKMAKMILTNMIFGALYMETDRKQAVSDLTAALAREVGK